MQLYNPAKTFNLRVCQLECGRASVPCNKNTSLLLYTFWSLFCPQMPFTEILFLISLKSDVKMLYPATFIEEDERQNESLVLVY